MFNSNDIDIRMYCCSILSSESTESLKTYCKLNGIQNINSEFHVTLVNSDIVVEFEPLEYCGVTIPHYNISPAKWTVDGGKEILVLLLNSKWLEYRFKEARDYGATWDHPEYRPHITLSYDIDSSFDIKHLSQINFDIEIESEYCEY